MDPGTKLRLCYPEVGRAFVSVGGPQHLLQVVRPGLSNLQTTLCGKQVQPYNVPQTEEKPSIFVFVQGHLELNGRVKRPTAAFSPSKPVVFGNTSVLGFNIIGDSPPRWCLLCLTSTGICLLPMMDVRSILTKCFTMPGTGLRHSSHKIPNHT